jgi:hypothetical protein
MDDLKILRYSNIFSNDGTKCTKMIKEHYLAYVYSGELEINERGKITRIHKGECVFMREFYQTLDKKQISEDAKRDKVSVWKLPAN